MHALLLLSVLLACTTIASCRAPTPRGSTRVTSVPPPSTDPRARALRSPTPPVERDVALHEVARGLRREWAIPAAALATFTCETRRMAWDGVTRVDGDVPIDAHTRFPVESQIGPLLATIAVRLERHGVLRMDVPLRDLWPSAARRAPWYAHITLADLLSYQPPIPAFAFGDSARRVPPFTSAPDRSVVQVATRWFLAQRPDSLPVRWRTSEPSLVVAMGLLEQVTGRSMAELLHAEVLTPLGLRGDEAPTRERGDDMMLAAAAARAHGHVAHADTLRYPVRADARRDGALAGTSGLALSLPEYVTFLQAHLCAAQGRANALLTWEESLRLFGSSELGDESPLGWGSLNAPHDLIRVVQGQGQGFYGAGGFSKFTGRGALMLVTAQGWYPTLASRWAWEDGLGVETSLPRSPAELPRR